MHLPDLKDLKKSLNDRASLPPIEGSHDLIFNDHHIGFVHPSIMEDFIGFAYVKFSSGKFKIDMHKELLGLADPELFFAYKCQYFNQLAQYLRNKGHAKHWRNEQLSIWSGETEIAHVERAVSRELGIMTKAVHVNAWTREKKIYLSLRAPTKSTDPNKWDTLVGGLVSANESLEYALMRESAEEAGLHLEPIPLIIPLHYITTMNRPLIEGYQVEEVFNADYLIPDDVHLENQDGEVTKIEAFSIDEIIEKINNDEVTLEASIVLLDSIERIAKQV
ncbi:NUDIX hydrolase [Taylorella equigenitalis]|uniref:NUDIX hydrolase n=1 Tax=Taylorella equigenitalis TaxID=29575 RepID=UPI00237CF57C|nr:NUDIX domain-containing protein [Taylorella equigenitalis]WDU53436.1 NUDIX domain-containing protein [Taylorella equigenitalis]